MAKLDKLRSQRWLDREDFRSFNHRSRIMQMGYDPQDWQGKPVIAILNNWNDYNPCHQHFKQRADEVKRPQSRDKAQHPRNVMPLPLPETPAQEVRNLKRALPGGRNFH